MQYMASQSRLQTSVGYIRHRSRTQASSRVNRARELREKENTFAKNRSLDISAPARLESSGCRARATRRSPKSSRYINQAITSRLARATFCLPPNTAGVMPVLRTHCKQYTLYCDNMPERLRAYRKHCRVFQSILAYSRKWYLIKINNYWIYRPIKFIDVADGNTSPPAPRLATPQHDFATAPCGRLTDINRGRHCDAHHIRPRRLATAPLSAARPIGLLRPRWRQRHSYLNLCAGKQLRASNFADQVSITCPPFSPPTSPASASKQAQPGFSLDPPRVPPPPTGMLLIEGIPLPGCLCGRCADRLSARASGLAAAARRLAAASFRAGESLDGARAAAYAAQSRAARAEAEQCSQRAAAAASDAARRPFRAVLLAAFVSLIRLVAPPATCASLPPKWPTELVEGVAA